MNKKIYPFLVLLLFCQISFAQNRLSEHNSIGWYTTTANAKISKHWSGYFEYQWRRTKLIKDWQQSLIRIGATYHLNKNIAFQAGYTNLQSFIYGKYSIPSVEKNYDEHRAYEQATISNPIGNLHFSTRIRLEQRWHDVYHSTADTKPAAWKYTNRIRFMPQLEIPLGNSKYSTTIYDEIMIGFGKNVDRDIFDQNRIALQLGYRFSKTLKLNIGYINQIYMFGRQIDNKDVFSYNNGILVNAAFNF